jgi:hypothetical protein
MHYNLFIRKFTGLKGFPWLSLDLALWKLFAGKLSALRGRGLDRCIYDVYMGIKLGLDHSLLREYVESRELILVSMQVRGACLNPGDAILQAFYLAAC